MLRVGRPPTGSVHRDGSFFLCIVTGASVCCGRCTSSLVLYSQMGATLRRHFLRAVAAAVFYVHVAAATSAPCRGTSQQNIAFQIFLQLQTLRRHVSRPVAAGVYLSLKDVAASQYVCSRSADNLSSYVFPSGVIFLLRVSGGAMVDVDSSKGCAVQSEIVFHCSEASQSTTKVTKHSAATAGQLPLGTGREFLVD